MLDIQTRIFNIGMNGFILKPFNPQELKKKIALLLETQ
jgi:DNA-binding response OmpR family regulator